MDKVGVGALEPSGVAVSGFCVFFDQGFICRLNSQLIRLFRVKSEANTEVVHDYCG